MQSIGKLFTLISASLLIASSAIAAGSPGPDGDPAPIAGNTAYLNIFPNTPSSRDIKVSSWEGTPSDSGVPTGPLTPTKQFSGKFQKCAIEGAESLEVALMDNGEAYRKYTACSKSYQIEIKVIRYKSTRAWDEVPYGAPIEIDGKHITVPVYCGENSSNVETPALMYEQIKGEFENAPKNSGSACNSPVQAPAPMKAAAPARPAAANPVQKVVATAANQLAPLNQAPPGAAAPAASADGEKVITPNSIFEMLQHAREQQQKPTAASATTPTP